MRDRVEGSLAQPTNMTKIMIEALTLSFFIHIFVITTINFRLPTKRTLSRPSINFLGSFLASFDTQYHEHRPTLSTTSKETFRMPQAPSQTTKAKVELPKLSLSKALPIATKRTLPDSRATTETLKDQNTENQEIAEPFEHLPLRLPDYDNPRH